MFKNFPCCQARKGSYLAGNYWCPQVRTTFFENINAENKKNTGWRTHYNTLSTNICMKAIIGEDLQRHTWSKCHLIT